MRAKKLISRFRREEPGRQGEFVRARGGMVLDWRMGSGVLGVRSGLRVDGLSWNVVLSSWVRHGDDEA